MLIYHYNVMYKNRKRFKEKNVFKERKNDGINELFLNKNLHSF